MSNNDNLSSIPESVRDIMEGKGRSLEAIEAVIGTRTFSVVTYRVDYGNQLFPEASPRVAKLSKVEHRITDSKHLRLGSSKYYREYEGDIAGVADPEEARLTRNGPLDKVIRNWTGEQGEDPPRVLGYVNPRTMPKATVTFNVPDFLMFCTSIIPWSYVSGSLRKEFPDYDVATLIPDPSAFAMQLGKDFGSQFNTENVHHSGPDSLKQRLLEKATITTEGRLVQMGLDAAVIVAHGPVAYCDPPEKIINELSIHEHGNAAPFVKRRKFAGQREYRFVVQPIGEPRETEFLMEITEELRSLTQRLEEPKL